MYRKETHPSFWFFLVHTSPAKWSVAFSNLQLSIYWNFQEIGHNTSIHIRAWIPAIFRPNCQILCKPSNHCCNNQPLLGKICKCNQNRTGFESFLDEIFEISYSQTSCTGKSLSEALIFPSINPQYDNRLFMELPWTIFCHIAVAYLARVPWVQWYP